MSPSEEDPSRTYAIRITPRAGADTDAAYFRFDELLSAEVADEWKASSIEAVAMPRRCPIAPEGIRFRQEVRQLIYRMRPGSVAYHILFTILETEEDAPSSVSCTSDTVRPGLSHGPRLRRLTPPSNLRTTEERRKASAMDFQLVVLFGLTFIIHLIATLAYSVRIAGTRTGKIAISLALFNILVLVSRTSNSFQAPLLAKRIEHNLLAGVSAGAATDFRWLLLATSLATLLGAVLIPTFQRMFAHTVAAFSIYRSVPQLLQRGFSPQGLGYLRRSTCWPSRGNLAKLHGLGGVSTRVIVFNVAATAVSTVGVFAALYAGYLDPQLRVTASNLSAVVNGFATIFMAIFVDPYLSILTDDVMEGRVTEGVFRQSVVWLVGSRFAGTVLAQFLLLPAAMLIALAAQRL